MSDSTEERRAQKAERKKSKREERERKAEIFLYRQAKKRKVVQTRGKPWLEEEEEEDDGE